MSRHISSFALDELAAGLPASLSVTAHIADCPGCRAQLEALGAARASVLSSHEYARVWSRLQAKRESQEAPRWRWRLWAIGLAPALVMAAGVLLVIRGPEQPLAGARLKGSPSVQVITAIGGTPVARAHQGDRVALSVGSAGRRFALVLAIDASGKLEQLWPAQGASGEIARGAAVRLSGDFEVTAGSLTLHAFFTDEPLDAARAGTFLAHGQRGQDILQASTTLSVENSP